MNHHSVKNHPDTFIRSAFLCPRLAVFANVRKAAHQLAQRSDAHHLTERGEGVARRSPRLTRIGKAFICVHLCHLWAKTAEAMGWRQKGDKSNYSVLHPHLRPLDEAASPQGWWGRRHREWVRGRRVRGSVRGSGLLSQACFLGLGRLPR